MKRQLLAISLAAVGSLVGLCPLRAQNGEEYMYEIGPAVGASWAYGDVNRSSALYDPSLAYGLLFRYNVNLRWTFALDFTGNRLTGDSHDFDNVMPGGTDWSFDRRYWQFGIRPEFAFWNYGWGADYREKHRLAPFLTAGIGFGWANGSSSGDDRSTSTLALPVGIGMKWKMAPRWDLQLTCLWTKTFADGIDGITDPYAMGTTTPVNTDWIGSMMLSITFNFKERCLTCHNQDE